MDSLIFHVIAWPTLLIALLLFGFGPGAVLRMIVLAFRRDDPRRTELLAELPPRRPRALPPSSRAWGARSTALQGITLRSSRHGSSRRCQPG
jgi:hypothetical protein